ncbi:MAG: hypothetical protein KAJ55_04465 [Anaerolineales bacterium]|nr:hypothetical protein [Anaerolineales bacterium]
MATPTGRPADEARGFFARVRRRKKQDQSDFSGVHDFGAAVPSAAFPNPLTLPANIRIRVELFSGSGSIPIGDTLFSDGITQAFNSEPILGQTTIRALFKEGRDLTITRGVFAATGLLLVYFVGPKTQKTLIAQATFS